MCVYIYVCIYRHINRLCLSFLLQRYVRLCDVTQISQTYKHLIWMSFYLWIIGWEGKLWKIKYKASNFENEMEKPYETSKLNYQKFCNQLFNNCLQEVFHWESVQTLLNIKKQNVSRVYVPFCFYSLISANDTPAKACPLYIPFSRQFIGN